MIDTLRADRLPFYGYPLQTAPFLSRLAETSVVFEQARSTSSWTAPATASLFTGVYPQQHGVVTSRLSAPPEHRIPLKRIPRELETLPEFLRAAGYRTYGVADNYNVSEEMGFADGFDWFVSEPDQYRGAAYVNDLLYGKREEILEGNDPYFLYVHYMDPHYPYHERRDWLHVEEGASLGMSALYDSEIGYVDAHLKQLFDRFGWSADTAEGSSRETLVWIMSDHGEEFWDHGGVAHDRTLYDEVLRVPLMVTSVGGVMPPGRITAPVSLVDVFPTITEQVGGDPDPVHVGRSLAPLLGSERSTVELEQAWLSRQHFAHLERVFFEPWRKGLVWQPEGDREHYLAVATIEGSWKLIADARGRTQLFDLGQDPAEARDLAARHPETVVRLSQEGRRAMRSLPRYATEELDVELSEEARRRLEALGYVQ